MSISRDQYRRARHLVDDAGSHLQKAIRPSKRGRPSLDVRIFLTGMVLSLDLCGSATVTDIYETLTTHLPRELQWELGVLWGDPEAPQQLRQDQLYALTKRITAALDYSVARAPHLDREAAQARQSELWEFSRRILAATLVPRPDGSAEYALDGTAIWAHERGHKSSKAVSLGVGHEEDLEIPAAPEDVPATPNPDTPEHDPSCVPADLLGGDTTESGTHLTDEDVDSGRPARRGRGNKGPSDAAYGAKTAKNGEREWYFGYDVETLVRVPAIKGESTGGHSEPILIENLVVLPASTDIVAPCLDMIDRLMGGGVSVKALIVDRHYSFKRYRRWFRELLHRGIRQVADLHEADQGFRDWDGMKVAASWIHCPATPDHLGTIPSLSPTASDAERAAHAELVTQRQAFAAQRVAAFNTKGESRWRCPARYGTVGCELVDGSVAVAHAGYLPIVDSPPPEAGRPKICCQETVQITVETQAQERAMKLYQKEYWGSQKWQRDYNRRTYVEGAFGILKGDSATDFDRGSIQFVGLPLVTIAISCAAALTNVRLLRSWHAETGLGDECHPLLQPDAPFLGFTQLTPDTALELDRAVASSATPVAAGGEKAA